MKIPKTFRLSEEAVAELDKQPNATQYLEDLILNGGQRVYEVVPLHQLEALLEQLGGANDTSRGSSGKTPAILDIPGLTTADKLTYEPMD